MMMIIGFEQIMSEMSLSESDDEVDLFTCTMYLTMLEKESEENIFLCNLFQKVRIVNS